MCQTYDEADIARCPLFIEKCDANIQFCRIIGLVGIFSKNKIEYRPLLKISLLVHANWWECISTVML